MHRLVTFGLVAALLVLLHCAGTCTAVPFDRPAAEKAPPCHKNKASSQAAENCGLGKIAADSQERPLTLEAAICAVAPAGLAGAPLAAVPASSAGAPRLSDFLVRSPLPLRL